jgi:phosphohistidine phosphatase
LILIRINSFLIQHLMKTLYLIRHAKSSWDDLDLADFERPLNERGEKDAPRMGKRLKEKNVSPDLMLSSPAKRALETCKVFAKTLGYAERKVKTDRRLYHADEDQLLNVIREIEDLNDKDEVVMIFGHNPGLTEFANSLLDETLDNIPTCGVVSLKIRVKSWKEIKFGSGEMKFFDFPKNKTH